MKTRILLVAATNQEIASLPAMIRNQTGVCPEVLITGIGVAATVFHLTQRLQTQACDLVLHIGVAGSFQPSYPPGTVLQVRRDTFAALGAERSGAFIPGFRLGFCNAHPFTGPWLEQTTTPLPGLGCVTGVTVDTVSGSEPTISRICREFNPDIETMESAALFYVCLSLSQPFHEIRAISNPVAPDNRVQWEIPRAIRALEASIPKLLTSL
jgi:futalosine hydrolase